MKAEKGMLEFARSGNQILIWFYVKINYALSVDVDNLYFIDTNICFSQVYKNGEKVIQNEI